MGNSLTAWSWRPKSSAFTRTTTATIFKEATSNGGRSEHRTCKTFLKTMETSWVRLSTWLVMLKSWPSKIGRAEPRWPIPPVSHKRPSEQAFVDLFGLCHWCETVVFAACKGFVEIGKSGECTVKLPSPKVPEFMPKRFKRNQWMTRLWRRNPTV